MVVIKQEEIILVLLDYLHQNGLTKSMLSLEEESGVTLFKFCEKIQFVRTLILSGDWKRVIDQLEPIKQANPSLFSELILDIK